MHLKPVTCGKLLLSTEVEILAILLKIPVLALQVSHREGHSSLSRTIALRPKQERKAYYLRLASAPGAPRVLDSLRYRGLAL